MGCQLGSLDVTRAHRLSMDSLPGRGEEKKKHWHGRESFMGTKREDFMISLKDKKSERSKNLVILWGKCDGFFNVVFIGSFVLSINENVILASCYPVLLA